MTLYTVVDWGGVKIWCDIIHSSGLGWGEDDGVTLYTVVDWGEVKIWCDIIHSSGLGWGEDML